MGWGGNERELRKGDGKGPEKYKVIVIVGNYEQLLIIGAKEKPSRSR